jgi:hypothetical protein
LAVESGTASEGNHARQPQTRLCYEQTGPGPADITSAGGFFSARVFFMNPGDYIGGTVTFPGGGSGSLTSEGANVIGYGASNTSLSQLQADYPAGGYAYDVTGSQPEATFTINYAGDAYSNAPYITNFSSLEDMDAKDPFTVEFNTYVPGPNANSSAIYFTISNSSGTVVYNASPFGLPDGTTSVTIPAGTLVAGGSYTFDLLYDNRINGSTDVTGDGTPDSIQVTQFCDTQTGCSPRFPSPRPGR